MERLLVYLNNTFDSNIEKNHALLFLIKLAFNIDIPYPIDEAVISKLSKDNIIERDYIEPRFILKIPIFDNDVVIDGRLKKADEINNIQNDVENFIDEYRSMFKGYRIGNMGNRKRCINLMVRFILDNSNYTINDIRSAVHYYIQNTEPRFITSAENFIFRITDKGEESKLYDVMEELRFMSNESNLL